MRCPSVDMRLRRMRYLAALPFMPAVTSGSCPQSVPASPHLTDLDGAACHAFSGGARRQVIGLLANLAHSCCSLWAFGKGRTVNSKVQQPGSFFQGVGGALHSQNVVSAGCLLGALIASSPQDPVNCFQDVKSTGAAA